MQKYTDLVLSNGRPVAGATVAVTTFPGGATPVIFADNGVTIIAGSVVTTDTNGRFSFYAADGRYTLTVAGPSISTQVIDDILLEDPADGSAVTVLGGSVNNSPVGNVTPSTGAFSKVTSLALSNQLEIGYADSKKRAQFNYDADANVLSIGVEDGYSLTPIVFRNNGAERMRIEAGGGVGIGGVAQTGVALQLWKNPTGAANVYSLYQTGVVQSDVTNAAFGFRNLASTVSAAFTLPTYMHFNAVQGTIGAGSAITSQYGFQSDNSLIGATANYAFYAGNTAAITTGKLAYGFYSAVNAPTGGGTAYGFASAGTADNYMMGRLGVGGGPGPDVSFVVQRGTTGGAFAAGIRYNGTTQADVTSRSDNFQSVVNVAAGTYNIVSCYYAQQATITGSVTNQFGFAADASLVGATNNYGFYGNIPAGTGRYNLYMSGTAANYFAGNTGIGTVPAVTAKLALGGSLTGGVDQNGISFSGTIASDATGNTWVFNSNPSTQASAFTVNNLIHFEASQGTIGAGSTVTNQYGFRVESNIVGATNNYGFFGAIPAGTNRYNLYMAGTAPNRFVGETLVIGATGGLGYGTGAGGTVTQLTSQVTAVTLNKPSGAVTMFSAAGSASWQVFLLNNSLIGADDTVNVTIRIGSANVYNIFASRITTGQCAIFFQSVVGTAVEAPAFNFTVIKGATA